MLYAIVAIGYALVLLSIGLIKSRTVKTHDDFMVAGRAVPTALLVGTLLCTWIGSGSIIAGAGLAYRQGLSELWLSAGAWAGIAIVYFLAGRVRRIAEYTLPDLLERRYHPAARVLGTLAVITAYTTIVGYQFRGLGYVLRLTLGIPDAYGVWIGCAFVVLFTALAGMVSIVSVDILNGSIIILVVLILVPWLLFAIGPGEVAANLPVAHLDLLGQEPGTGAPHPWYWAAGIFFPTFFLLLGESNMYQKFFSAKNERSARTAVIWWIIGTIVIESFICFMVVLALGRARQMAGPPPTEVVAGALDTKARTPAGVADPDWWDLTLPAAAEPRLNDASGPGDVFLKTRFADQDGTVRQRSEEIALRMARHPGAIGLPTWVGLMLLAAAMAIIVSTANSFLLTPSTNIMRDIYQRFIDPGASAATLVWGQRLCIVALGVLAASLLRFFPSVLAMAFTAYTMVGAGITPAVLAAFLWRRASAAGGVASIAAGMGVTLAITVANAVRAEPLLETDYIVLPAAAASILALIVVSLLTPPPPPEKVRPFMETS